MNERNMNDFVNETQTGERMENDDDVDDDDDNGEKENDKRS